MISYNGYKTNCITIENGNAKVGDIVSIDSNTSPDERLIFS